MKTFLSRIHARVGDLWWYSAMIFLACRSGDVIQAFIGLWLVPKYVGPQELGAVLPLQQLTSFLTVPLAIVAVVFSKYVNTYATRGEYGKVKSFIHDVFTCSFILFVVCIAGAYLIMPFFYERLRISSGSLTFLILLCGLVTNLGSIIGSAQQGLKRFKIMSIMTFLGAPIRLITLLVAMPFRALSGYILGQTTPGATTATLAIFDIRKVLKSYKPDTSWRKDLPEIWRYLWPIAIYMSCNAFFSSLNMTIYRQRLPEVESSAYYLITRFAEVSGYIGCSMLTVLVPLASEAHEKGTYSQKILLHTITATVGSALLLAIIFAFAGESLFSLTTSWREYTPFVRILPLQTLVTGLATSIGIIVSFDMACRRFKTATLALLTNLLWIAFLVSFTGADYFVGILPDAFVSTMKSARIATLSRLTCLTLGFSLFQLALTAATSYSTAKRANQHNSVNHHFSR